MSKEGLKMSSGSSNIALKIINNQMDVYNFAFGMHCGNKELEDVSCLYLCASSWPQYEADIA